MLFKTEHALKEISGMDRFSLQAGGGSHAIYAIVSIIRAWVDATGQQDTKDEIITTIFSHPSNAAAPVIKGFKVINIYPDAEGRPDFEAPQGGGERPYCSVAHHQPRGCGDLQSPDQGVYRSGALRGRAL